MKAFSSAVSITAHVVLGAAALLGTVKTGRSDPVPIIERPLFFHAASPVVNGGGGISLPAPISVPPVDVRSLPVPAVVKTGALATPFSPMYSGAVSNSVYGQPGDPSVAVMEEHAEVVSGPLPVYPELLRQAGVQGRVVLEAVVDTTGRVLVPSILVVSRTNPGFVAAARQALLATLFRPAMSGGKAVQMRVRIPYEFAIRNGAGRTR